MMFLTLALFAVRIKRPSGETAHATVLVGERLSESIKQSKRSVLLIHDYMDLAFADFGIRAYKDRISFIRAPQSEGNNYECTEFPCFRAFEDGTMITGLPEPENTATGFVRWLKRVMRPEIVVLDVPEELREVIEGDEVAVIGIGVDKRPSNVPLSEKFFYTTSDVFEFFNVSVTEGVYVYRPADRELVDANGKKWEDLCNAEIAMNSKLNFTNKKYFAGFAIDRADDDACIKEMEIMKNLRKKHGNVMEFAPLYGKVADTYEEYGQLENLEKPFFFVFETDSLEGGRWLIYNDVERMHDETKVSEFIASIVAGKEQYSVITERAVPVAEQGLYRKLVATDLEEFIGQDKDVLVAFTTSELGTPRVLQAVLNESARILESVGSIEFGYIDCHKNDLPESVPAIEAYPALWLFPAGKKDAPVLYKGFRKVRVVMQFVQEHANPFEMPEFNSDDADDHVHKVLHPPKEE